MPSHIKHMDKMHKISVISNTPLSQLSVGISFIVQNFILKNSKFHSLTWNCPLISTLLTNIFMLFFKIQLKETFSIRWACNTPIDLHYFFVLICVSPRALMWGTKSTLKERLSDPMKTMLLL